MQRWLLEFGHWKIHIFTSCWFQWWISCNICMSLKRTFCAMSMPRNDFLFRNLYRDLFNRTVEYTRTHFLFHTRFSKCFFYRVGKSSQRIIFKFYAHFSPFLYPSFKLLQILQILLYYDFTTVKKFTKNNVSHGLRYTQQMYLTVWK